MPSISSLLSKISSDYPVITFVQSETFRWSPKEQTVYYRDGSDTNSFLHEVAHAALGHDRYSLDIELLQMERDAWDYAGSVLAPKYGLTIDQDTVEPMLDTYRDWLHARSTCPACQSTGVQTRAKEYFCVACEKKWRVNEARSCALRRYTLSKTCS